MTRGSVGADVVRGKLAELDRARGQAGKRRICHELSRLLDLACVDSPLIAEVATALERHGLPTDALPDASALRAGEAFALFVGPEGGVAARLAVGAGTGQPVSAAVVRDATLGLSRLAARAARRLPIETEDVRVLSIGTFLIEGRSHGLAVAAALLSRALQRPPVRHVVAAACLGADGHLRPVLGLGQKLGALRSRWPEVTDVVVAPDQADVGRLSEDGWNVRVADHLAPALAFLGLDFLALPADAAGTDLELGREATLSTTTAYRDRAEALLLDVGRLERRSFFARIRAAHCLVHAGDAEAAYALLPPVDAAEQLGVDAYARCLTIRATAAIDRIDGSGCVGDAALAVEVLHRQQQPDALLLGEAMGTLGRAYLRSGAYREAIAHLEGACAHFEELLPAETARTRTYLATALRLGGEASAALIVVEQALAAAPAGGTRTYQLLERARCRLALADAAGAIDDCRVALDLLDRGTLYPRVGLLLTLRAAASELGDAAIQLEAGEAIERVRAASDCPELVRRLIDGEPGTAMY